MNLLTNIREWLRKPNAAQPRECAQCGRSAVFFDGVTQQWFCTQRCCDKWKLALIDWIQNESESFTVDRDDPFKDRLRKKRNSLPGEKWKDHT